METEPRLKEVEERLRGTQPPEVVDRAMRLIRFPATEWNEEDARFMDAVLREHKRSEETKTGCLLWVLILLCISGAVAWLTKR